MHGFPYHRSFSTSIPRLLRAPIRQSLHYCTSKYADGSTTSIVLVERRLNIVIYRRPQFSFLKLRANRPAHVYRSSITWIHPERPWEGRALSKVPTLLRMFWKLSDAGLPAQLRCNPRTIERRIEDVFERTHKTSRQCCQVRRLHRNGSSDLFHSTAPSVLG